MPSAEYASVTFTAFGTLDDYPEPTRQAILNQLATTAGLPTSTGSSITIVAGSVIIDVELALTASNDFTSVSSLLQSALGSAEAASALLNITVESAPVVAESRRVVNADGSPGELVLDTTGQALSGGNPPGGPGSGGMSGGTVVLIIMLVLLPVIGGVGAWQYKKRRAKASSQRFRTNPSAMGGGGFMPGEISASPANFLQSSPGSPFGTTSTTGTAPLQLPPLQMEIVKDEKKSSTAVSNPPVAFDDALEFQMKI